MIHNISSRILKNLLIHDLDNFFISNFNKPRIAISPIMPAYNGLNDYDHSFDLLIKGTIKSFRLSVYTKNLQNSEISKLFNHINSTTYHAQIIFSVLFKDIYKFTLSDADHYSEKESDNLIEKNRIDLSFINSDREIFLSIEFPLKLLKLFSRKIEQQSGSEFIEDEIRYFFKKPINIFPRLKIILESFSNIELQNLLYQLQKNNLLTTYQICLIVLSFPENSLRLKKNLSIHTVQDVQTMMKTIKRSIIKKRDLIGGVYSIEEAIYFLMKKGVDFSYSRFLKDIQIALETISRIEVLLYRNFSQWIEEMIESGLLYKTLSISEESIIAKSISSNSDKYIKILKSQISERRLIDILSSIKGEEVSYMEQIFSQSSMVSNYRRLKFKKLNLGDESFVYLLRRFSRPTDYSNFLFSVGWFILSTALKGMKRKSIRSLLQNIPLPARYLIEDVIKGVINPNILHDEMQIYRARSICVKSIISMYEDGFIELIDL